MSTTYNPSATATQAPASQPDPDAFPAETLPASGDGATAASVAQAFKVLGDYIAWERAPRAKASSWIQAIKKYMNAALQTRFVIDHLGFPMGKIIAWDEDWGVCPVVTYSTIATVYPIGGRWCIKINGSGGQLTSGLVTNGLKAVPGVGDITITTLKPVITPDANSVFVLQWDVFTGGGGASSYTNMEWDAGGFVDTLLPGAGHFSGLGITGAMIVKRVGDANWQLYTKTNAGAAAYVDTGVAALATQRRMRVECIGASASDNGTAQVIAYIDGSLVAQVAVAPFTSTSAYPMFRASYASGGSASDPAISPCSVMFRGSTWAGNVIL